MNIKQLLEEDKFSFKFKARTYGDTYSSPCPWCGGKDRFRCWPNNGDGGNWFCQKCERKGGTVKYLMEFRGMNYLEACRVLGKTPGTRRFSFRKQTLQQVDDWIPLTPPQAPHVLWQTLSKTFIHESSEYLYTEPSCAQIRSWLYARGLKDETLKNFGIGWNWTNRFCLRKDWGLPEKLNDEGTPLKLFIPEGLVIPNSRDGQLQGMKIRRSDFQNRSKYYMVPGSSNVPMLLGKGKSVIVVESELDAILISQEAEDLVCVVALGSAQMRPDLKTTEILREAKTVLISLDSDDAGAQSYWRWWSKYFPKSKRWPVLFGKDPSDAYQQGLNLRDWVLAGLSDSNEKIDCQSVLNIPDSRLITDSALMKNEISKLDNCNALVINVVTTGKNNFTDHIQYIQISASNLPIVTIDFQSFTEDGVEPLKQLFQRPIVKCFHDAKSQLEFLTRVGFQVNGPFFDTMLASQILKSGLENKNYSLHETAAEYLKNEPNVMDDAWENEEVNQDVSKIKRLINILIPELEKAGLMETAELEFNCIPAVVKMELNGMLLDQNKWDLLSSRLLKEKRNLELSLYERLGKINLDSPEQLLKVLKSKNIPIEDTKRENLIPLSEKHPVLKILLEYRRVSKIVQGFILKLPNHVSSVTGRIHPEYLQMGAVTGRFSCMNPNLQQTPRDKEIRSCFIPAPGYGFVMADYSQIELRITAEISGDKKMIEAYQKGMDLHRLTASLLMNKDIMEITKDERQAAKAVNFGLIYAMGARGLKMYAENNYGVKMTMAQAQTFRNRFFSAYKGLVDWHRQVSQSGLKETRTLGGRRRLWQGKTNLPGLLNSPVQGTSADITKRALSMLPKTLNGTGAKIIGTVHDEIILEVPQEMLNQTALVLRETMESAGLYYLKKIPVEVDVSIVDSLAKN